MSGKIFINYRRGDDPGNTGRLFDQLEGAFPRDRLFMDVDSIAPGRDFARALEEQVAQCDILLAVIGKGWIDARDDQGVRRLDKPDDFVRIEIASALKQDKLVIPVLVHDARMPKPDELPEALRPLAGRNAFRLTHERFKADAQSLIKAIQQALNEAGALRRAQEEAARKARAPHQRWHRVLQGLGGAVALVAVGGGVVWTLQPRLTTEPATTDRSIRTFTGHSGAMLSVAFAPDGYTALSSSADNTLKLWEVATGKEVRIFTGHSGSVMSVAFSRDGRTALSGSNDSTLKLWEVATGKELRTFMAPSGQMIWSVALSHDGRSALSGSRDTTLKLWEAETGKELRTFTGHTNWVVSVKFAPDGRTALSGSADKTLKLWEVATGKEIRTFTGHSDFLGSVAFSPDGRTALSSSADKTLKLWEVATGKEVRTFMGHSSGVPSVAFSPDGRTALSGSLDSTLRLWDVATGKKLHTFTGHSGEVYSVVFSPDGRTALSASRDGTLKLWDVTGR